LKCTPLGDQAVIVYLADESAAVRFTASVRVEAPDWLQDVVPAYASVGIFFDVAKIGTHDVIAWLAQVEVVADTPANSQSHIIPICYEMGLDAAAIRDATGLTQDDVIRLHSSVEYSVYAIGFVPGFPYLGYLPQPLAGVPRLATPRTRVEPGSVGVTGKQTGIYPLARPGGWHLLGRTPLTIVDIQAGYFPIRVGDRVSFRRIDEAEFSRLLGKRLPSGFTS